MQKNNAKTRIRISSGGKKGKEKKRRRLTGGGGGSWVDKVELEIFGEHPRKKRLGKRGTSGLVGRFRRIPAQNTRLGGAVLRKTIVVNNK